MSSGGSVTELRMQLWQGVPYIPMGEFWQSTDYRKDLLDVLPGCFCRILGYSPNLTRME
jgi:hypothetical protein